MIYFRKLKESLPDEPELNLYWARDAFGPRFFYQLCGELMRASRNADLKRVQRCWSDMKEVLPVLRRRVRWPIQLIVPILDLANHFSLYWLAPRILRFALRW